MQLPKEQSQNAGDAGMESSFDLTTAVRRQEKYQRNVL
jgi:hypothetical protein